MQQASSYPTAHLQSQYFLHSNNLLATYRSKLVRQMAFAAILTVVVERHEHTSTALGVLNP